MGNQADLQAKPAPATVGQGSGIICLGGDKGELKQAHAVVAGGHEPIALGENRRGNGGADRPFEGHVGGIVGAIAAGPPVGEAGGTQLGADV